MHNQPTRAESSTVWYFGENGLMLSFDHGVTWGVDTYGNMLVNVLTAKGINADWIVVGTLSGVRIETVTGKIGPYDISTTGLTSSTMQFFDDGDYPLIWMEKPANGEGSEGWGKSNYEPDALLLRSVENGIETRVSALARKDEETNISGEFKIDKYDIANSQYTQRITLSEDELSIVKYTDGLRSESVRLNKYSIAFSNHSGSTAASIWYDKDADELNIQAGGVRINGVLK